MVMITTTDNPYDPITQYEEWFAWDEQMGYHTCSYLARIARTYIDMTPKEYEEEIERAIDEIIKEHGYEIYRKVKRNDPEGGKI